VLRRLHDGLASLACLFTAAAVGFGAAPACSRRRLGIAPLARWTRSARLRAHHRRRWHLRGLCVQPALARCRATCALVSPRLVASSSPSPLASARPLCAVGAGSVLRHWHAGLDDAPDDAPLACWARRRPWRGWIDAGVSAASPLDTRIRLGSSPSPLASAWPLRAVGVLTASLLDTLVSPDSARELIAVAVGSTVASSRGRCQPTSPLNTHASLSSICVLIAVAVAVGFGAALACSRHRHGSAFRHAGLA